MYSTPCWYYVYFQLANGTETIAEAQEDGSFRLFGHKWFSSATDSDMALTLARVRDIHGQTVLVSYTV